MPGIGGQFDLDAHVPGGQPDLLEGVHRGEGGIVHLEHLARHLMAFAGAVDEPGRAVLVGQADDVQREGVAGAEGAGDPLALVEDVVGEAFFQGAVDEQEVWAWGRALFSEIVEKPEPV